MTTDVLVIHGVANRDEKAFNDRVRKLSQDVNAGGSAFRFVGAFWGDLGGEGANLPDTLPPSVLTVRGESRDALVEHVYGMRRAMRIEVRSEDEVVGFIVTGARLRIASDAPPRFAVRGEGGEDEVGIAITEEVRASTFIRNVRDPDIAQAIGEVIGASLTSSPTAAIETRGFVSGVRDTVKRVVRAIDDLLGAITGEALGALNQAARRALSTAAALSLGDILAFRHASNGEAIRQRVLAALAQAGIDPAKPLVVVAHSLGGLIAVDMVLGGRLRVSHLVTVGSQPAMFHVMKPLDGLQRYVPGTRSLFPRDRIDRWTNLWHPLDPLSFLVGPIFELPTGLPTDVEIHTPLSTIVKDHFWMHSAYWESGELVAAIR